MNEEIDANNSSPEMDDTSLKRQDPGVTVLEAALEDLNRSIGRLEALIADLESAGLDSQESFRLITEANDMAMSLSQNLDRLVQGVAYGSADRSFSEEEEASRQQSLDLPG